VHDMDGTANDHRECYSYDGRNNLVSAHTDAATAACGGALAGGPVSLAYNKAYAVNEIGNLTNGPAGTYTYPASGVGSVRPHAPSTVGGMSMTWNNDGTQKTKVVAGVTSTFGWDALDRLVSVAKGAQLTSMVYFPGGQRAIMKDSAGVHLFLDGFAERHVNTSNVVTERRYYMLGSTMVASRSKAGTDAATVEFYLGDIRGSTSVSVVRGTATNSVAFYDPYGNPRGTSSIASTDKGYIGQYEDPATGLSYLNNRYYDPTVGVFTRVDPLVSVTGEPYLYASGNPTSRSDPTGLLDISNIHDIKNETCGRGGCGANALPPSNPQPGVNCGAPPFSFDCPRGPTNVYVGPSHTGWVSPEMVTDPTKWCLVGLPVGTEAECGAPPTTGEYGDPGQVRAVLDYLSTFGGPVADGLGGAASEATVSVAGYTTARGTTVLSYTRYRAGLADLGNGIAPAGKLVVGTRVVGRAFVALQPGVTAFDSWRATEGHSTLYRLSYTAVKTAVTTGGAVGGAALGLKGGAFLGSFGGPIGTVVGGGIGAAVLGFGGFFLSDKATDFVWAFTYEEVSG
jgi:RHS repeat-associated protein